MPSRQLFRGLFFCFYPQPSLFRINGVKANAARHFGATIETKPSLQTTHILVARESAKSRPFWGFVRAAALDADCVIVDNEWCSQCIDSGKLLDTRAFIIDMSSRDTEGNTKPKTAVPESPAEGLKASSSASSPRTSRPSSPLNGLNMLQSSSPARPLSPSGAFSASNISPIKRSSESPLPGSSISPSKRARPTRARREDALSSIGISTTWPPSSSPLSSGPTSARSSPHSSPPPSSSRPQSPVSGNFASKPPAPRTVSPEGGILRASRTVSPPFEAQVSLQGSKKLVSELSGSADTGSTHPNQTLLDIFHDFMVARQATGDDFSARAYERALKVLQDTPTPIHSYDDAIKLPNFTQKMARLVDDVQNGALPRALKGPMKEMTSTLALFTTVYGVGPAIARALYDRGCRTLEDIKPYIDDNGRYSIAHHADFQERMRRSEVDVHYGKIKDLVASVDADVRSCCMGSYRRGEETCGDIDVILTREGASIAQLKKVLKTLLNNMFACGFAGHTFSMGSTRWLGATQVNGKMRRMDILLVPWQELGAAMIYYTGNNTFNRQMRLGALKQGLRLNEKGLYRVDEAGSKELIEGHDERRIFELLGWPWLEPHDRRL